ncbi:hypothetical protein DFH07DRAFT_123891 [Mycena maculata]|uniref:Uncharacterized protein n=1 Tax=Mycena maculata TaxID=230809 RepID=A0AAD7JY17_9AGAR|nr:hypothetical protein DFH07DRAFT_123891 [Mycena maculata]
MDPAAPEPCSAPAPDLMPIHDGGGDVPVSSRGSPIRHLAILSAILAPIAFLPYFLTRRRLTTLRRRVDEMGATTALLKHRHPLGPSGETGATTALLTQMRQDMDAMRAQLEHNDSERAKSLSDMTMDVIHINEELDHIRGDIMTASGAQSASPISREETAVDEQIRLLRNEQDALRTELFKMTNQSQSAQTGPDVVDSTELHRLIHETRQTRAIFGAIGSSLGDVATIVQRVEIEMGHERPSSGYDPVERLRVLAMHLQDETFQGERKGRGRH